jgi:hypothetical protein
MHLRVHEIKSNLICQQRLVIVASREEGVQNGCHLSSIIKYGEALADSGVVGGGHLQGGRMWQCVRVGKGIALLEQRDVFNKSLNCSKGTNAPPPPFHTHAHTHTPSLNKTHPINLEANAHSATQTHLLVERDHKP